MMWHKTWTAPLGWNGSVGFCRVLVRKKYPAARERALTKDKYEASLSMASTMSLAVNRTVASG